MEIKGVFNVIECSFSSAHLMEGTFGGFTNLKGMLPMVDRKSS